MQYSTFVRAARMVATVATIGASAKLLLFSGAEPANCLSADPAGLVATLSLPSTWMGAPITVGDIVTMAMAGGIVLYASLPGTHPQSPQPSAALRPPAYDGAPLTVPASTGLPPPLPLGAVQGERDGGASGSMSGQPHPPTSHPARKASRENDNPVRL